MDGVSIAASIVGIATAGVQVSIKLVNLATQVKTASDRVSSIANDISLTSGVLHQLGELINQKTTDGGISIFSQHGLETTRTSAAMCERIFQEIEKETKKASGQLRKFKPGRGIMSGEKIELSILEKAKWPFLQPNIDTLRVELRDAKSTLMLMLQVTSLALNKRALDTSLSTSEHEDYVRTIVALELQRRISTKQQEGSEPSRSNDAPNSGNANTNTVSSGTGTLHFDDNPQPSSSRAPHTGQKRSRAPFVNLFVGNSPDTTLPRLYRNSNVPGIRTASSSNPSPSSNSDSETRTHPSKELQLFFLKPEVLDFSDKIELYWSMQDANMQQYAIHEHITKNEKDGLPSVVDMLQQLHPYEQKMVESQTSKVDGGSVLSLKRTRKDIPCRDMLFTAVPGLQFVIQRQIRQPEHGYPPEGYGSDSSGFDHYRRRPMRRIMPPQEYSSLGRHFRRARRSNLRPKADESEPEPEPEFTLGGAGFLNLELAPDIAYSSDDDMESQEDKEAEALVTELLAKYTILSP